MTTNTQDQAYGTDLVALTRQTQKAERVQCRRCGRDWTHATIRRMMDTKDFYAGGGCPQCRPGKRIRWDG